MGDFHPSLTKLVHAMFMTNYRRCHIPGASYFFTVNLSDRGGSTLVDQIDALRLAYRQCYVERPFFSDAVVVMPDHLHAVWTLPPGDADFSTRWRLIKARFSRAIGKMGGNHPSYAKSRSQMNKGERGVWQRRFWEHTIRDETDFRQHVEYCWGNPVKHGLVARASDWPFSSMHRDMRAGRVDGEWRGGLIGGRFRE